MGRVKDIYDPVSCNDGNQFPAVAERCRSMNRLMVNIVNIRTNI